jgi:DNA-binding transcriptional regulator YdaS (Cro superfamily)
MKTSDTILAAKALVTFFGNSQTATASALKVKQPTVNGWLSGKHHISAVVALRAERITNGHFQAMEISRELSALDQ